MMMEAYKDAAYELIKWAKRVQLPSGAFSQAVFHNGEYLYQGEQTQLPVKDYVMLMGFRGVSQILDYEENNDVLGLTVKVADYLCSQGENFGDVLMHPNSDISVYEVNEDDSRASRTETNIMAIDVLCSAFENTEDEKYLKWILKFLDAYIASSVGGIGGGTREQGYRGTLGWSSDNPRITSLLRTSDNLNVIFNNHADYIKQLGYDHLNIIFGENAKYVGEVDNISVAYPAVISNVYESSGTEIIYVYNQFRQGAAEDESWAQTAKVEFEENSLYQGAENTINSDGRVSVEQLLDKREHMVLMQRPLSVEIIEGNAKINIDKYESDVIELSVKGDVKAELKVKSGTFPIVNGEKYNAKITSADGITKIQIKRGTNLTANNEELTVSIGSSGTDNGENNSRDEYGDIGSNWGNGSNPYIKPSEKEEEPPKVEEEKPEKKPLEITVSEFDDVDKTHWAYKPLMYLKQLDIMVGNQNVVRPDDFITRGEAVKIIVMSFNITADKKTTSFIDAKDMWWEEYAAIAAARGVVNGVDNNIFDGKGIITREMMAVMIKRAMDCSGITLESANKDKNFKDKDEISNYALDAINSLYKMGVVSGMGNDLFAPAEKLTRAQAAQIIYNVISNTEVEVTQ